jgi:hypothetical protein
MHVDDHLSECGFQRIVNTSISGKLILFGERRLHSRYYSTPLFNVPIPDDHIAETIST